MKVENLNDLFVHTLKDIYFAERQIVKSLPKMVKTANSKELAKALEAHLSETKEQVSRLEQVFKLIGEKAKGEKCPAIEGILEEAKELMDEIKDPDTRDAAMIGAAQAVEHYEITRYGTLVAWGKLLGLKDAVKLLVGDPQGRAQCRYEAHQDCGKQAQQASGLRPIGPLLPDAKPGGFPLAFAAWPGVHENVSICPARLFFGRESAGISAALQELATSAPRTSNDIAGHLACTVQGWPWTCVPFFVAP